MMLPVRRWKNVGLAVLLAASAMAALVPAEASAVYYKSIWNNGWPFPQPCLDSDANTSTDGTIVQLWSCNGQGQQQWTAILYTPTGAYAFHDNKDGPAWCLDADLTQDYNGGKVQIWYCNGWTNQGWFLSSSSTGTITSQWRPKRCLDADTNGGGRDGTKVQLWSCNGQANQLWSMDASVT